MKGIEARVLVPTLCAANPVIAVDLNDLPARPFSQPIKTMLSLVQTYVAFCVARIPNPDSANRGMVAER